MKETYEQPRLEVLDLGGGVLVDDGGITTSPGDGGDTYVDSGLSND